MGANSSQHNWDSIPVLRPSDKRALYFPPKFRKIPPEGDCFLAAGMVVNTRGTAVQVRRHWINLGFDIIHMSKTGLVVIDAFGDAAHPCRSALYILGQRVRRICSLSAPPTTQVLPRIPIFVFPRSPAHGETCRRTLLEAGLPINDIIIAQHSATKDTLAQSPLIERMVDRGLDYVHVVDCSNFFEVPSDPLVLGFMAQHEADFCVKTQKREKWDDPFPLYALKVVVPQNDKADTDDMTSVVDTNVCDDTVLKMSHQEFYSFRRKSKIQDMKLSSSLDPGGPTACQSPCSNTDEKGRSSSSSARKLAFNYSALPSFIVSTKVLYDCQKSRRRTDDTVNLTDFCQNATSLLVPENSIASTYQELESFVLCRRADVRDDSLLVILTMSGEWDGVASRGYDTVIDERLDNIKEYPGDRCTVYESRSPRFPPVIDDTANAGQSPNFKSKKSRIYHERWKNPFGRLCCVQNIEGQIAVDTINLVTNDYE